MLESIKKYKVLIGVVIILIVSFTAYQKLFVNNKEATGLIETQLVTQQFGVGVAGRDIINLLNEVESLNLEAAFLSDSAFMQLADFRQQIFSEPVGRNNPFSPVGSDGFYDGVPVSLPSDKPAETDNPTDEEVIDTIKDNSGLDVLP